MFKRSAGYHRRIASEDHAVSEASRYSCKLSGLRAFDSGETIPWRPIPRFAPVTLCVTFVTRFAASSHDAHKSSRARAMKLFHWISETPRCLVFVRRRRCGSRWSKTFRRAKATVTKRASSLHARPSW